MGFSRACSPVRCAHPYFLAHCHPKRGAARLPPCPSQLHCFLFNPQKYIKSILLGPPTSRAFLFPLDHRGYEIWGPLPPALPIADSLILPAIFWGHNYVPVRLYAQIFSVLPFFYSFWIFSFCYTLLFLLSFSISSYSSLLILSFSSYIFLFFS